MSGLALLIPISLGLGVLALLAFRWTLDNAQYDDLDGAAERILFEDDEPDQPGKAAKGLSRTDP